jgi:PucR C-terminal helix-turn-helix domain
MSATGRGLKRRSSAGSSDVQQILAALSARMMARLPEIEEAASARVRSLTGPKSVLDVEYVDGLRSAISVAIQYGLAIIACNPNRPPTIPAALLIQARLAARNGVTLVTVLNRYFAGYTVLSHFLVDEIGEDPAETAILKGLLQAHAPLFERLIRTVTEEYMREAQNPLGSSEQRKLEKIERLLAGEILDTSDLAYPFDAYHLGAIGTGPGAAGAIRKLAKSLDALLLSVRPAEETVWAWFAARRRLDPNRIEAFISSDWSSGVCLAVGEPGHAQAGWRVTHRQAAAALPIVLRNGRSFVRYRDVALTASMAQDDLLATSLRELYLAPLELGRDAGEVLRETLRAYFAAGRNATAAAEALKVNRRTVTYRLRKIEKALESPLAPIATEVEFALRLHDVAAKSLQFCNRSVR